MSEFLKIAHRKETVEDLLWNLLSKEEDGKTLSIVSITSSEFTEFSWLHSVHPLHQRNILWILAMGLLEYTENI